MPKRVPDAWIGSLLGNAAPLTPEPPGLEPHRKSLTLLDPANRDVRVFAPGPVCYAEAASPVGRLLVAASARGLVRIAFGASPEELERELLERFGARPVASREPLRPALAQLEEYFAGRRRTFDLEADLSGLTPFQRRVLEETVRIPAGCALSYGALARRIGKPGGARAVGQALGRNPVPIVIPCHRVLAERGRIGGYTGGIAIKQKLLEIEGVLGGLPFR